MVSDALGNDNEESKPYLASGVSYGDASKEEISCKSKAGRFEYTSVKL